MSITDDGVLHRFDSDGHGIAVGQCQLATGNRDHVRIVEKLQAGGRRKFLCYQAAMTVAYAMSCPTGNMTWHRCAVAG